MLSAVFCMQIFIRSAAMMPGNRITGDDVKLEVRAAAQSACTSMHTHHDSPTPCLLDLFVQSRLTGLGCMAAST